MYGGISTRRLRFFLVSNALLEPGHRDDPQALFEVELVGRGETQLAGAHPGEHQQPQV